MANIALWGANYSDVPAVTLPTVGGGTATFYENAAAESQTIFCGDNAPSASVGNNGDVFMLMSSGDSKELYPADMTAKNMNSTSALENCIGVSAEDGSSTSNVYSSGSGVTGTADYTFDFSDIPANAVISSLSLSVKAHEENASRSTCTIGLYAGSTAKGSITTVDGTSNKIYSINTGTWTRAELDTLVMRLSLGYYGGLIAGATLTVSYSLADSSFSVTLTGNSNGWSISGNGIYQKNNGVWAAVSSAALENTIVKN